MTWFINQEGYEIYFNRDERVSRSRAELPAIHNHNGVDYIAPTDADAGGTWIAANQFGITVCLLNHYQFEQIATGKNWTSRGEIVRRFADIKYLESAEQRFQNLDLRDFRAFRMFIIDREGNNRLFIWDAHLARTEINISGPRSSSSVNSQQIKSLRKQLFRDLNLHQSKDSRDYLKYHASHHPARSHESVCMHRDDASTVSLSYIRLIGNRMAFSYTDGPPCETESGPPLTIAVNDSHHSVARLN